MLRKPHYECITDDQVSPFDRDATLVQYAPDASAMLGHPDQYVVDGGKACLILRALVPPVSIMDHTPTLDLVDWVGCRWRIS